MPHNIYQYLDVKEVTCEGCLGGRGGLVLLRGLLWWNPGLDGAPEVAKSCEGGPEELAGTGPIGVFKGEGNGGDLSNPEGLRVVDPRRKLPDGEGCIDGVLCCQFFMYLFWE